MRELPRQLSVEQLAELFEGRTRFVERGEPLGRARDVAASLTDDEKKEVLDAHPAIGERKKKLSTRSAREQGDAADEATSAELKRLNAEYEARFGFRFVVFVNGRPKRELLPILRGRLGRTREEELSTALDELVSIALDRWRRG